VAISELSSFTVDPVSITQLDTSYDTLEYIYDRKANSNKPIRFDRMRLRTLQLAEKMALSYAMAQSSKLFVFESRVLDSVEATRYLPKELAKSGIYVCTCINTSHTYIYNSIYICILLYVYIFAYIYIHI
jgi:uncharacterized Rmd1/YagE family protein